MTYFIRETVYAIHPDGKLEWRDECSGKFIDHEGTVFTNAEERFYAKIVDELETAAMYGNSLTEQEDMLHVQEWFLDEACTMLALKIEISEHQLMHNLSVGVDNALPECDIELRTCNMLHEAEVPNKHTDIEVVNERLYRNRDGSFILVCNHKETSPSIRWYQEKSVITQKEAAAWGKKHMNAWVYNAIFGTFDPDDDMVPVSFMLEKSTAQKLHQFAKSTGRSVNDVTQEALYTYLK